MDGDDSPWIELSHPIGPDVARMPFLPAPTFEPVDDAALPATDVTIVTHVGTHIEAPRHRFEDGATIDAYAPDRWITRGVVCDVDVDGPEPIEPTHLDPPTPVASGDALLIRTGWDEHVGTPAYSDPPYLTPASAEWIADRAVSWVGIDSPSPERPDDVGAQDSDYPVHSVLLGNDVLVAENLTNLGPVAGGAIEVVALPIRYVGAEAAQARIVARRR